MQLSILFRTEVEESRGAEGAVAPLPAWGQAGRSWKVFQGIAREARGQRDCCHLQQSHWPLAS
eukprot:5084809-Alexandrium_andersonii.AAC.1